MKKLWFYPALATLFVAVPCTAQSSSLTDVEETVAKVQIQELIYRYALIHNTDDPEGYAALFTEDGEFGPFKGRAAILEMARGEVVKMHKGGIVSDENGHIFGFMRSLILNPVIDIIDDTHAKGISYLQVVVPNVDDNNIPTILFMGTYQDEYRKVDGKWLIAKRNSYGNMSYPGLGKKLGLGPAE